LFFDQLGYGAGHFVEGFTERAELVALMDADSLGEIAAADVERGFVKIVNRRRDGAGEDETSSQAGDAEEQENYGGGYEQNFQNWADVADGSEQAAVER
jgi:hypothetical protein